MKKSLLYTAAGMLAIGMLASAAQADTLIDKGALGKYERQGRFVKPLQTPTPRSESTVPAADTAVLVDKGDLGTYIRHGRFLRPVLHVGLQGWASAEGVVPASSVTHEHGINGKEHKNIGRKRAH